MTINIKETLNIRPTRPTQHSPIVLTNNDLVNPTVYIYVHHFFKNVGNKKDFMDIHKLRSSLEDLLSDYYPLAGRLKNEPEGRMSIVCTDQSIPFVIAESSDLTIKKFEEKNWQPTSIPHELINNTTVGLAKITVDAPLLIVQHTTLADGSVVIGTGMHHSVADGHGLFYFLENWGRKTRQESIIPPVHDRSLLKSSGNLPTYEHHEFRVSKPRNDVNKPLVPPTFPPMTTELFHINNDNLKKLHNAYSSKDKDSWISTNDALVAHFWRLITKARGIPLDSQVACGFASDGRERLKPSFPSNYFGNFNLNVVPRMLASELINGPQTNVALQVRDATNEMNDSKIRSAIDWIEQQPNKFQIQSNFDFYCGKDLVLTNWSKFPLYALDFGYGVPIRFSLKPGINLDGVIIILGDPSNDGIGIWLSLITEHMQKLEQDPEFKKYL